MTRLVKILDKFTVELDSALAVGEIIEFDGVHGVGKLWRVPLPRLQRFVVTGFSGRTTSIYPSLVAKGQFATVSKLPGRGTQVRIITP